MTSPKQADVEMANMNSSFLVDEESGRTERLDSISLTEGENPLGGHSPQGAGLQAQTNAQGFARLNDEYVDQTLGADSRKIRKGLIALVSIIVAGAIIGGIVLYFHLRGSHHDSACSWSDYRLPKAFVPSNYTLTWDLKNSFVSPYPFSGMVIIDVETVLASRCLVLHNEGLTITAASVTTPAEQTFALTFGMNAANQQMVITLPFIANPGDHFQLILMYAGTLDTNMRGLYLSTYETSAGKEEIMISTQFEATYARYAIPCFDEPQMKARWTVAISNVPAALTVLSNNEEKTVQVDEKSNLKTVVFKQTPPMSSYLLACVVGNLNSTRSMFGKDNSKLMRAWARSELVEQTHFALDVGVKALNFYEQYYGIEYPLPKLDAGAIPDFAAGAMENWGLVLYRETAMLIDETNSNLLFKLRVAVVVSHELAHQWFGNYVTMQWWNDLWLNEGFATFMEYKGVDAADPNFNIYTAFLQDTRMRGMAVDSLSNVHPLSSPESAIDSSAKIESLFDDISYSKGAAIINMYSSYFNGLVHDGFLKGVNAYLTAHAYGNAIAQDLWSALINQIDTQQYPITTDDLGSYVSQNGYPVITVQYASNQLKLSQQRFFLSSYSAKIDESSSSQLYFVPLQLASGSSDAVASVNTELLQQPFRTQEWSGSLTYDAASDQYLLVNANCSAYVRVAYPEEMWTAISQALQKQLTNAAGAATRSVTPWERMCLIDDAVTLGISDTVDNSAWNTVKSFQFLDAWLQDERDIGVWDVMLSFYGQISGLLQADNMQSGDTVCVDNFYSKISSSIGGFYSTIGFSMQPAENAIVTRLRPRVLSLLSAIGDQGVITNCSALVQDFLASKPVDNNIVGVCMCSFVRWGDASAYSKIKDFYATTTDVSFKSVALDCLAATHDIDTLNSTISYALSDAVRKQDTPYLLRAIARNPAGRLLYLDALQQNLVAQELLARYGTGGFSLNVLISALSAVNTDSGLAQFQSVFDLNAWGAGEESILQTIEQINSNIIWRNNQEASFCNYLAGN